ncbi:MAG: 2'-5' RNA ligase family protein [Aeromicrobium sp.]
MVQSVELLVDEVLDRDVRVEWERLRAAGLPSQARHTGPSNAPHVTLGVAERLTPEAERALGFVDYGIGGPIGLGGLLVFPGRTSILSRVVVPSAELIGLHGAVQSALGDLSAGPGTMAPGRWTPHVTLARRLDRDQLAAALALLAERPRELAGTIRAARRWDGEARTAWDLAGGS